MQLYNQAKTVTFSGSFSLIHTRNSYTDVHQHIHINTQLKINKILVGLWRSIKVMS